MAVKTNGELRLNLRELKIVIEEAAAALGQSVDDYAVSALVRDARLVLEQSAVTKLSDRDRDRFLAALDDADARPKKVLVEAAKRYKKRMS